ncbi:MAG: hypothetical protein IPL46_18155 [Saprospiraceae bacterium]|nr:hypothetical protein [Saprospiraceae bacterium]
MEFVHAYDGAILSFDLDVVFNKDERLPKNSSIHNVANRFMALPTFGNID